MCGAFPPRLPGVVQRRKRLAKPEPLSDVLSRAAPDRGARAAAPLPEHAWQRAVGDRIARRTRPLRIEQRVLLVLAATGVWAQELSFLAPTIVERLVAQGFDIERLRFRVGPIDPPLREARPVARRSIPATQPLPPTVSREIAKIDDPPLRQAIARAAAASLAWQRAPGAASTAEPRAARAPRSSAPESVPPDHSSRAGRGAGTRRT